MPTILTQITTPAGAGSPDILANANKVSVGAGVTEGTDPVGGKETVTHGNLDAVEVVPIANDTTAHVFVSRDGTQAFLDPREDGGNLPVARAVRLGRAWKGSTGDYIVCQGRRGAGVVSYNIAGDPVPRRLVDAGSAASPVVPRSPFQGAGRMTFDVSVTVKGGGTATITIVDTTGNVVDTRTYGTGNNQPDQIVLGNIGDVLEFITDPGTTLTMTVTQGTETV